MKKIKVKKLYLENSFYVMVLLLLFTQSCSKKPELDNDIGEVTIKVIPSISMFTDGGIKKLGNAPGTEVLTNYIDFNKDYLLVTSLIALSEYPADKASNGLKSNNKRANSDAPKFETGNVYKLIIYNADGSYRTFRNYKYGSEDLSPSLSLPVNQSYTFVAYSLSDNNYDALNNAFLDSTVVLNQAKIIIDNNPNLLVYKNTATINENNKELGITFKHQFSEITTVIDASLTGYSIDMTSLKTSFNIAKNRATISFSDMSQVNTAAGGFQTDVDGTGGYIFTAENNTANSIATAKNPILINTDATTSFFTIRNIKVGSLTNSNLNPFPSGIALNHGYKYILNITITPKDKTLEYADKPAVILGGQVWMRYSLGSLGDLNNANGSDADIIGDNTHGAYYQWGKQKSGINANSREVNSNWDNYGIPGNVGTSYFTRWNSGSQTAPIKGSQDPCPPGFRLPVKKDFETLLAYIENDYRKFIGISGNKDYGLQLTSKYNKNAKLTFAASGYGYMGNDNGQYNVGFGGLLGRYKEIHLKTSYYGNGTPNLVSSAGSPDGKAYQTNYMLYSPVLGSTGTNRIMIYPGSARVSASVNAHPVRCIAIKSAAEIIQMREREIESGGSNNVDY